MKAVLLLAVVAIVFQLASADPLSLLPITSLGGLVATLGGLLTALLATVLGLVCTVVGALVGSILFNFTAVFQLLTSTVIQLLTLLGIPQLLAALGLPINLTALLGL